MASRVSELRNGKTATGSFADLDDRMLVLDFQAGHSDEAYAEIHRRYVALARHICLRILGNPHDAEEATQETMLRVFQGLSRFNGRYAVQPWVARIATNVSLDITRARARRPQTADRTLDTLEDDHAYEHLGVDPGEAVERNLEGERVNGVLLDLPERHREALVLREYEGRSHKEIGDALGVTPTQAKALIHRARGSFRRIWAGSDGDAGLAGLFVFLFLLPYRAVGVLRRLADRAGDASQAAGSASPTVTAAAASPAVQVAAAETGQKVVAAAVTLLVAGSVTVGAAALTHHRAQLPPPASPSAAVVAPSPPVGSGAPTRTVKAKKDPRSSLGKPANAVGPVGAVTGTPSTDPSGGPSTDPSGGPSTDPSGPPSAIPPPVAPAPGWSGSFKVDWASQDECGCKSGVSVGTTTVSGQLTADSALDVDQSFQGAALDAEGDAAWAVSAEYQAHLQADGGTVALVFSLGSGDDTHQYVMSASSPAIDGTPGDGNPIVYVFSGYYSEVGANSDTSPIPVQGAVQLRLSVWGDGTSVYGVGFDAWR
jgi:RNA polymerase sigma-70 factor, ECF subfamily